VGQHGQGLTNTESSPQNPASTPGCPKPLCKGSPKPLSPCRDLLRLPAVCSPPGQSHAATQVLVPFLVPQAGAQKPPPSPSRGARGDTITPLRPPHPWHSPAPRRGLTGGGTSSTGPLETASGRRSSACPPCWCCRGCCALSWSTPSSRPTCRT